LARSDIHRTEAGSSKLFSFLAASFSGGEGVRETRIARASNACMEACS
jgi:hypothetical protein